MFSEMRNFRDLGDAKPETRVACGLCGEVSACEDWGEDENYPCDMCGTHIAAVCPSCKGLIDVWTWPNGVTPA